MAIISYPWAVQHGLQRTNTNKLQSLWMEIPGYCNLACSYCFAKGGETVNKDALMTYKEIESVLSQGKKMGIDSFGIPGAGEPLLPINKDLTIKILKLCADLQIFVALFTTAEFIDDDLADELFKLPVEILVKCNSLDPDLQDRFVSDISRQRVIEGYGKKRNKGLEILLNHGFADKEKSQSQFGRKSRLALVTSIMSDKEHGLSNLSDVKNILRFCREHNIIFDCDSILKRGRGVTCQLHTEDEEYRTTLLELQKIDHDEFNNDWQITQSYAGGPACDRYHHHLYVTQYGEIHPCIGATGVSLGNIRTTTLQDAWNSTEMQIIRNRNYKGKCGEECANFAEHKCNSCLGRRTINLNNAFLQEYGFVETIGCWNFRKK